MDNDPNKKLSYRGLFTNIMVASIELQKEEKAIITKNMMNIMTQGDQDAPQELLDEIHTIINKYVETILKVRSEGEYTELLYSQVKNLFKGMGDPTK